MKRKRNNIRKENALSNSSVLILKSSSKPISVNLCFIDLNVKIIFLKSPLKLGRLDYILKSENFTNVVEDMNIKSGYQYDFSAVVVEFR